MAPMPGETRKEAKREKNLSTRKRASASLSLMQKLCTSGRPRASPGWSSTSTPLPMP
jgi:hypothetical protein